MILSIIALILIATFINIFYNYYLKGKLWIWTMKRKYGEKVHGIFYAFFGAQYEIFVKSSQKYGLPSYNLIKLKEQNPAIKAIVGGGQHHNSFLITDPELAKQALQMDIHKFEKTFRFFCFSDMFGEGVLFTNGDKWKRQRTLLNNEFHFSKIKESFHKVLDASSSVIKQFMDNHLDQKPVDICKFLMKITGEVIFRTFLGGQWATFRNNKSQLLTVELIEILLDVGNVSLQPNHLMKQQLFGNHYQNYDFLLNKQQYAFKQRLKRFKQELMYLIDQRIKIFEEIQENKTADIKDTCVMDVLARDFVKNQQSTKEELLQQFMTFFFAGMDTSGNTTAFVLYALARYPDVYEKTMQEINQIKELKIDDLNKMDYLNALIKEVMRIWPVVTLSVGRIIKNEEKIGEFQIPAGTVVSVSPFVLQRDDNQFENPEEFNPDRFYKSQLQTNPFSNIPFLAGPRNCIGQHLALLEMKVMIIQILKNFKPRLNIEGEIKFKVKVVMSPQTDELLYLERLLEK